MSEPKPPYQTPKQREQASGKVEPKPRAKPKHEESNMQKVCVRWFSLQYPRLILYANANHGKRTAFGGFLETEQGLKKGVPDLFLACKRGVHGGLYLEAKIQPNKPSREQTLLMQQLRLAGYACEVFYSVDEFMQIVTDYLALPTP